MSIKLPENLDVSKAFDLVDYENVRDNIKILGIKGLAINFFRAS